MRNIFEKIFDRIDEIILERGDDGFRHLYSLALTNAYVGLLNQLGFEHIGNGECLVKDEIENLVFKYKAKRVFGQQDSIELYKIRIGLEVENEKLREIIRHSKLGEMPASMIENHLIEWRKRLEAKRKIEIIC